MKEKIKKINLNKSMPEENFDKKYIKKWGNNPARR